MREANLIFWLLFFHISNGKPRFRGRFSIPACRNSDLEVEIGTFCSQSHDPEVYITISARQNPDLEVEMGTFCSQSCDPEVYIAIPERQNPDLEVKIGTFWS